MRLVLDTNVVVSGLTWSGPPRRLLERTRIGNVCGACCKEGIKAILIYPMNALAMDQARRIAQTIHRTPSLRGRVSAGLYVGESERTPHTAMGPDHVITDRGTLRERPPAVQRRHVLGAAGAEELPAADGTGRKTRR